jgi:hypothetical protein
MKKTLILARLYHHFCLRIYTGSQNSLGYYALTLKVLTTLMLPAALAIVVLLS